MPKISIITPTYKWTWYIAQTIESVRSQSFDNYEHIIVNDNSPDNVEEIVQQYQKDDDRIIIVNNKKNLWIAWSRNRWIELAGWEYICFLDHDDVFLDSSKLQKQYNFLSKQKDYWIVSSLIITIDQNGNEIRKNHGRETDIDIRRHFLQSNQFLPCAMMIRKQAIIEYWWFDSNYDKSDDYDLRMKIGRTWKMYCIQEYMTWYRVHEHNTSWTIKALYQMRWLSWKIFWKNKNYYPNFLKALIVRVIERLLPPSLIQRLVIFIK
jgi:glycosyltransferase involved in cell wall biosynthesis